ncbi:MAG TPA: sulfocyanin-like copper-binding protein [Opitutaceae bacterium]|nr:sulfocyanin-like copper-binding protein [Opitutaceae bacterium]
MKSIFVTILFTASVLVLGAADSTPPSAHHAHAASSDGPTSGLKKEMIAGLTEKDFLKKGTKDKTVKILIVATWSDDNYGMNFNGWSKGGAVYTLPKGWTAEVTFINPGPVPHSLIVIEKAAVKKIQMPEPYFDGAVVPKHLQGMSYEKATFTFTASESGDFAFACGFPTHAINGHWISLEISDDAKEPTLQLGNNPVMKATP